MLLLLLALPAVVEGQFTFTTNNGAITITGYTGPGGAVTIPGTTNGWPITSIGYQAFWSCTSLTSVTIPSGVTNIEVYAFGGCSILSTVAIPDSVTSIGNYAFLYCSGLTAITVDASNTVYSSVDGVLFNKSQTTLIQYSGGKAGAYTIPDSVTNVLDNAFAYGFSLSGVTVGNHVTSIGYSAFWLCTNLTSVTLPDSVVHIKGRAFYCCTRLSSVTIGSGLSLIDSQTFWSCPSLTEITVDARNSVYSSVDGVLFNKSQTTLLLCPEGKAGAYTIPNGVNGIDAEAFIDCFDLSSVTLPDSLTSIGGDAFYDCVNLSSVTIGNGLIDIGLGAFQRCASLTGVYFEGNAPSADANVFQGDNRATVYYLPGTTGWTYLFNGLFTALWSLPPPLILNNNPSFGVKGDRFGFIISWAINTDVVVEACTDLASPTWIPVATNTLTSGWSYFSDPQWTNYPGRFYRLRSP